MTTVLDGPPPPIPHDPLNEAIGVLIRAGHRVVPASPVFGGLWHVDRGPQVTGAQLIAMAGAITRGTDPIQPAAETDDGVQL